jgi:O-antigen/teichoic acid export membrane protein
VRVLDFLKNKFQSIQNDERTKMLFISSLSTFISKGISFFVLFLSMPMVLSYLGEIKFAIYSTIVSTINLLNYFDLGIGMGVQNILPRLISKGKSDEINSLLSTAFFFLLLSGLIIILIGLGTLDWFNWIDFFKLKNINTIVVKNTIITIVILIGFWVPISLIQRVQSAYQQVYINEWVISIGNLIGLLFLVLSIKYKLDLPYIVFSLQGSILIAVLLNFIYSFYKFKQIKLKYSYFNISVFKNLFKTSIKYLFLSICSVGLYGVDNFLLLKYQKPIDVTLYNIAFRFTSILNIPVLIFSIPFLSSFNDAIEKNDNIWIKNIIKSALKYIGIYSIFIMIILFFEGNKFIHLWLNYDISFNSYEMTVLCLLLFFLNYNVFISMISLNSRYVNHTIPLFLISILTSVLLKIFLLTRFDLGFISVIIPTALIVPLIYLIPMLILIYKKQFK